MNSAYETLRAAGHVLLDFDGPVCAVFGAVTDVEVVGVLCERLGEGGYELPGTVRDAADPFEMVARAGSIGSDLVAAVEAEFSHWEQRAALGGRLTPGIHEVLTWLAASGRTVTIVSNNAVAAIESHLRVNGLDTLVDGVSARRSDNVDRLKPHPHLLRQGIVARGTTPERCVMIGDSAGDIQAATALGTPAIAYADRPDDHEKLAAHSPHAIVHHLSELLPTDRT